MSISLRAPTVVAKFACVAAELGRGAHLDLQVAGGELDLAAVLRISTLARIGSVCPLDDARDGLQRARNFSCAAFKTIIGVLFQFNWWF